MENEPYKIQHDYQQQAAEYLRQALECDEQSKNHELAISLYNKGIEELEQAINVNIDPNDNRAIELRTKMRRNLAMAHERVEILRKSMVSCKDVLCPMLVFLFICPPDSRASIILPAKR
ncbi:unnamed protein product [Rotaria sordida]|uniref:MIT domain-containing protein n=1 Tax=Rotaria sordida TaxID=392033 RepID=A0A820ANL6_9BILA|nr:unnamed protein product [Rotaria sordida]